MNLAALRASSSHVYRYAIANTRRGWDSMNRGDMSSARRWFWMPSISNLDAASAIDWSWSNEDRWGCGWMLSGRQRRRRSVSVSVSSVI